MCGRIREEGGDFVAKGLATEVHGDDAALGVEEVHARDAGDVVAFGDGAFPALEGGNVNPVEAVFLDGVFPGGFVVVEGDAVDLEAFVLVVVVDGLHVGYFRQAGTTPGRPEVQQDVFAPQGGELDDGAVGCSLFNFRGDASHVDGSEGFDFLCQQLAGVGGFYLGGEVVVQAFHFFDGIFLSDVFANDVGDGHAVVAGVDEVLDFFV